MSDVNGHLVILDKVVFLVSDYELLILFWAISSAIDHHNVPCCKNMITILGFTTLDLNEFASSFMKEIPFISVNFWTAVFIWVLLLSKII